MNCNYVCRDFNRGSSGEFELFLLVDSVIVIITCIHESMGSQAIIKIKINKNINLYDAINTIFYKLTQDYNDKTEGIPYKDYIMGENISDNCDNGQNAPCLPFTRENLKLVYPSNDDWLNNNTRINYGEINENGDFIYNYPLNNSTY